MFIPQAEIFWLRALHCRISYQHTRPVARTIECAYYPISRIPGFKPCYDNPRLLDWHHRFRTSIIYLENLPCWYYYRCIECYTIRTKKENTLIRPSNHLENCTFIVEPSKSMQRPNRSGVEPRPSWTPWLRARASGGARNLEPTLKILSTLQTVPFCTASRKGTGPESWLVQCFPQTSQVD